MRRAEVLHFGAVSAGPDSGFFLFHAQRNRLWVLLKNVPSPLLWLTVALQIVAVPLTMLRRPPGKWRAALKGVIAGFRGLPTAWRQRRKVQNERVVSSLEIAKMLVWDPRKALSHAPRFIAKAPRAAEAPQAAIDA